MDAITALFALLMGIGMAGIWTRDIQSGNGFEAPDGLLRARETGTGSLIAWHWLAEFGTATLLVVGGLLTLLGAALAEGILLVGLGALAYSAANSLGWSLARPERRPYAIPMFVGLIGGVLGILVLLLA